MESWRDNMDNANMSHLPKFDEVSDCFDTLDSAISNLECLGDVSEFDDIATVADEIEDALSEAECTSFPGMY